MNSTDTNNVRDAIIVVEAGNIEAERYYQGAQEPIYPHQPHDTTTAESGTESCSSIKSTKKPTLLLLVVECTSEEMERNFFFFSRCFNFFYFKNTEQIRNL
eukprot:gb/GECH01003008.1/.p1 GENE.gb/GECH01003008.1/~~gb/GECH01003008.1/.p1  ORF type:complete len:101 (+),score=23.51 gb/GECH01003008.1/:1-303(+)